MKFRKQRFQSYKTAEERGQWRTYLGIRSRSGPLMAWRDVIVKTSLRLTWTEQRHIRRRSGLKDSSNGSKFTIRGMLVR